MIARFEHHRHAQPGEPFGRCGIFGMFRALGQIAGADDRVGLFDGYGFRPVPVNDIGEPGKNPVESLWEITGSIGEDGPVVQRL